MHHEPAELGVDDDSRKREPAARRLVVVPVEPDVFGPGADDVGAGGEPDGLTVLADLDRVVEDAVSRDVERQPVRHADEAGHVLRCRLLVDLLGRGELLDPTGAHDCEPVPESERFRLVVCHVDRGEAEAAVELVDLGSHLVTEPCVEIAQRLVEEDELGPGDEAARERDALLLAAAQLAGVPVEQRLTVDEGRRLLDPLGRAVALSVRRALSG